MPMLPKRCCSDPMCGAVAAPGSSRCPAHARALQRSYDDRRGTTVERGYDSDHERLRVLCFVRDEWRCKVCGWEPDVVRDCRLAGVDAPPVEVVLDELRRAKLAGERHLHMDHIIRIEDRPELRLDLSNVQTLCSLCHARKTMAERRAPAMVGGTGTASAIAIAAATAVGRVAGAIAQRGAAGRQSPSTGRETRYSQKCLIDGTPELAQFRDRRPLASQLWPTPRLARPILPPLAGIASPVPGTRRSAPSQPAPTAPTSWGQPGAPAPPLFARGPGHVMPDEPLAPAARTQSGTTGASPHACPN